MDVRVVTQRISLTVSDEHFECLKEIAKQNRTPLSLTVYKIIDEWFRMKALQFDIAEAIDVAIASAEAKDAGPAN